MECKTPLYENHVGCGGKIVPFAGYLLPVQYTGIIEEHMAVRKAAGLFDVSHMGEIIVSGKDALNNLNALLTNEFSDMEAGRVRYSVICNERGGVVDDVLVYKTEKTGYMLVVNAANRKKALGFLQAHIQGDATLSDISDSVAQLALQGPNSKTILLKLTEEDNLPKKYYTFTENKQVAGVECTISRTGYTGEFGYELYCASADAAQLWEALLKTGEEEGLIPCGLGARDTLRFEAAMPLYGHEMNDEISPLEAGLSFCVKMQKESFMGKDALLQKGEPNRKRAGLKLLGRGVAREHCEVYVEGVRIGETTSGTHCPYLNGAYAMALIQKEYAEPGTKVEIEVRGRRIEAQVVELPFIKK